MYLLKIILFENVRKLYNPSTECRSQSVLKIICRATQLKIALSLHFSRSLERSRPIRRPTQTSESCSDSEPSTALGRASVPSLDKKDLQRAVAHLQETLQQKSAPQRPLVACPGARSKPWYIVAPKRGL